jgi:putative oxidoreductase
MISPTAPLGAALLRITQGSLFLGHVGYRLTYIGIPAAEVFFASLGLPGWTAILVTLLEAMGGLALMLGAFTRISALVLACILVGTIVFVHGQNGFLFTNHNGGWEYSLLWAVALVAQALIGPGKWAFRDK